MGRYARLLLAHLWTEAVRGESPEIHLARSWSNLCALLAIQNTGGVNGTCHQIRKQLRRLVDLSLEVRRHERIRSIPLRPEARPSSQASPSSPPPISRSTESGPAETLRSVSAPNSWPTSAKARLPLI